MKPLWTFRILAVVIALAVGGVATSNLVAEWWRQQAPLLPARGTTICSPDQLAAARWGTSMTLGRTDLAAELVITLALRTLGAPTDTNAGCNQEAQAAAREALSAGPHDSRVWLALARLQTRTRVHDPRLAETLKMSYFTGPNLVELIPMRLALVVSSDALIDSDLQELARGDVRLILARRGDLKPALTEAYRSASAKGKQFIVESCRSIDPNFATAFSAAPM